MQNTIRKILFAIALCLGLAVLFWYFPSFHIAPNDPIFIGVLYRIGLCVVVFSPFCIPGLSFAIETLILRIIISAPIWSEIWSAIYICFESELFPMSLSYIECWLYITAYLIIALLQYGRAATREAEREKVKRINAPNKLTCKCCGEAMYPQDVFCNHCQTINPRVQAMIDAHPDRPPLEYQPLAGKNYLRCPHCRSNYIGPGPIGLTICTPIIGCKNCHNFFIDDTLVDWSVVNRSYKHLLMIGKPFTSVVVLILSYGYCTGCSNYWLYLPLIVLYLFYRFLYFRTVHYKEIHKSKLRLERNPEYPQILISMDYSKHMNKQYYPLMRFKPPSWLDIIKEAFTFD